VDRFIMRRWSIRVRRWGGGMWGLRIRIVE
jgi:hypothetical protein